MKTPGRHTCNLRSQRVKRSGHHSSGESTDGDTTLNFSHCSGRARANSQLVAEEGSIIRVQKGLKHCASQRCRLQVRCHPELFGSLLAPTFFLFVFTFVLFYFSKFSLLYSHIMRKHKQKPIKIDPETDAKIIFFIFFVFVFSFVFNFHVFFFIIWKHKEKPIKIHPETSTRIIFF